MFLILNSLRSNFVTKLSFGWEDKYNPTEAPNRLVKRAMEKENKKFRDVARKEYIERVKALVDYVRRRDPRIARMDAENKRKAQEMDEQKKEQK